VPGLGPHPAVPGCLGRASPGEQVEGHSIEGSPSEFSPMGSPIRVPMGTLGVGLVLSMPSRLKRWIQRRTGEGSEPKDLAMAGAG